MLSENEPAASAVLIGRRVFVVEDEALVSMLIQDMLVDIGCEIAGLASRFDDALSKAGTLSFDIALLDVNLAGDQTFPIAEALSLRGVPFVFATGYGIASLPASLQDRPNVNKLEKALVEALEPKSDGFSA
jgi:CheY-like chemotaxis protein